MNFLLGSKKNFLGFLDSISEKDNVAILTHNDLDGIASAIFLEEILENKGIKTQFVSFLAYDKEMLEKEYKLLKQKKINKLFLTDLGVDIADFKGFENLRKNFDVFLIDHHPMNSKLKNKKDIIKTDSGDCVSFVIYELGENLFNRKKWEWLVCSAMVSDISYKKENNFEFIKKMYPKITVENIWDSEVGELSKMISSALIYYVGNLEKVYGLVKRKDFGVLKKCRKVIDDEVEKYVKKFKQEAEFFPKKNLYFYYCKPKFNVVSIVTLLLSFEEVNSTFIFVSPMGKDYLKISVKNQSKKVDMNELMKKGVKGLENATGGGHVPASGGRIMKKDLKKFKENVLNF